MTFLVTLWLTQVAIDPWADTVACHQIGSFDCRIQSRLDLRRVLVYVQNGNVGRLICVASLSLRELYPISI